MSSTVCAFCRFFRQKKPNYLENISAFRFQGIRSFRRHCHFSETFVAGSRRNKVPDDNIFLEPLERIQISLDSGPRKDLSGLLNDAALRKLSVASAALVIP